MHDSFEFREDFARSEASTQCPVMLCPVKWAAIKEALDALRLLAQPYPELGVGKAARRAVAVLDQVGLTPDFDPSPVTSASPKPPQTGGDAQAQQNGL
jgi:hypothetical protein